MKTKVKKPDAKRPKAELPGGDGYGVQAELATKQVAAALGGLSSLAAMHAAAKANGVELAGKPADGKGLPWSKWPIELVALRDIKDDGENHRIPLSAAEERARQVKLEELAGSIKTCGGVMQPIAVQKGLAGGYDVIFGIRRRAAARLAGLEVIQARIAPGRLSRAEVHEFRAIENNQREELNNAERALAVKRVVDANAPMLGMEKAIDRAAVVFNLPRKTVTEMICIVNELSPGAREVLAKGGMHLQHARALIKIGDKARQTEIAEMIEASVKNGRTWSIQDVENLAANGRHSLKQVPWDPAAKMKTGVEGCEACIGCRYNTATKPTLPGMPSLYEGTLGTDEKDGLGYCTHPRGFERKSNMALEKRKELPKAAAAIAKDQKLEKSEAGSARVVAQAAHDIKADWLKLEPAARVVKRELGLQAPAKGEGAGAKNAAAAEKKEKSAKDLQQEALLKWGQAFGKWSDALFGKIVVAAEKDASVKAAAILLPLNALPKYHFPRHEHEVGNNTRPDAEKPLPPSQSKLLDAAGKRDLQSLLLLAEGAEPGVDFYDLPFHLSNDEMYAGPELCLRLAKAFGIATGAPPVFEDFLPKPAAAKGAKADAKEPIGPVIQLGLEGLPKSWDLTLQIFLGQDDEGRWHTGDLIEYPGTLSQRSCIGEPSFASYPEALVGARKFAEAWINKGIGQADRRDRVRVALYEMIDAATKAGPSQPPPTPVKK